MRIVLDTGVFFKPDALRAVAMLPNDVVVPAVAFTERARQIARDGGDVAVFERALAANDFTVEPYDRDAARRYAMHISDDTDWRRLARDAMIAGHVREDDELWTTNPDDFGEIGLPDQQVVGVP